MLVYVYITCSFIANYFFGTERMLQRITLGIFCCMVLRTLRCSMYEHVAVGIRHGFVTIQVIILYVKTRHHSYQHGPMAERKGPKADIREKGELLVHR